MKRVFLAGEEPNELGEWSHHPSYRKDPPLTGVIEALLREVEPDGWKVVDAVLWKKILYNYLIEANLTFHDAARPHTLPVLITWLAAILLLPACIEWNNAPICDGDADADADADTDTDADGDQPSVSDCTPGDQSVVGLAVGQHHSCVWLKSGEVWCWGLNDDGQLGDGRTSEQEATPVKAVPETGDMGCVIGVTAGRNHTCAWTFDHKAWCWGSDYNSQLGNGSESDEDVTSPQLLDDFPEVIDMAVGDDHTCALTKTNSVYCWGSSYIGQVGTSIERRKVHTPSEVEGIDNVDGIAAGGRHSCAWSNDEHQAQIWCWGNNNDGQLGDIDDFEDDCDDSNFCASTPEMIEYDSILHGTVVDMALGDAHSCMLTRTGVVYCWGDNIKHQLGVSGEGGTSSEPQPVEIGYDDIAGLTAFENHSCAWSCGDHAPVCWGDNSYCQLGYPNRSPGITKTSVTILDDGFKSVSMAAVGLWHTCALITADGSVRCWGYCGYDNLGGEEICGDSNVLCEDIAVINTWNP